MSTRSRIGILNPNGTIESVYCHQNGYPEYTGYFLENFYTNTKLVKLLLSKGDISNIATSYDWNLKTWSFFMQIFNDLKFFMCVTTLLHLKLWDSHLFFNRSTANTRIF